MYQILSLTVAALLMAGSTGYAQQQQSLQLYWRQYEEVKDTIWFFAITEQHDTLIDRLAGSIEGSMTHPHTGIYTWTSVSIPGLGTGLTLRLKDGLMSFDRNQASACWQPFDTEADKAQALAHTDEDHIRRTELEIVDTKGQAMLTTAQKRATAAAYLRRLLQP